MSSVEPVLDTYALSDYRECVIESNYGKICGALSFFSFVFFLASKRIARKMYGSESLSLVDSKALGNEARVMHRYIKDKAADDAAADVADCEQARAILCDADGHLRLKYLLRLAHSLGYRVTIRKVSDSSIERDPQGASQAAGRVKRYESSESFY